MTDERENLVREIINKVNKKEGLSYMIMQQKGDDVTVWIETINPKSGKDKILSDFKENMENVELLIQETLKKAEYN